MQKKLQKNKTNLNSFIDYYMEGNIRRFLRLHKKDYFFQRTYSKTLIKMKESNPKVYQKVMDKKLYPQDLRRALNVFITLDKHFAIGFTMKAFGEYLEIEEELTEVIGKYMNKVSIIRYKNPSLYKNPLTASQALKEQKARGFIHINDFEDFDPRTAHIISIVNDNYYYPINIAKYSKINKGDNYMVVSPYILSALIAVEGYTRINIPKEHSRI